MIMINSEGDTSNFTISGNAEEVAREYASLTLALKDKYYHIYDYALWLIQNEEKKDQEHKGIVYTDLNAQEVEIDEGGTNK